MTDDMMNLRTLVEKTPTPSRGTVAAVLGLLLMFTRINCFWIAALRLATTDCRSQGRSGRIADSVARIARPTRAEAFHRDAPPETSPTCALTP